MAKAESFVESQITAKRIAVAVAAGAGLFLTYRYFLQDDEPAQVTVPAIKDARRTAELREDARQRSRARRKRRSAVPVSSRSSSAERPAPSEASATPSTTTHSSKDTRKGKEDFEADSASVRSVSTTTSAKQGAPSTVPAAPVQPSGTGARNWDNGTGSGGAIRQVGPTADMPQGRLSPRSRSLSRRNGSWDQNQYQAQFASQVQAGSGTHLQQLRDELRFAQRQQQQQQQQQRPRSMSNVDGTKVDSKVFYDLLHLYAGVQQKEKQTHSPQQRSRSGSLGSDTTVGDIAEVGGGSDGGGGSASERTRKSSLGSRADSVDRIRGTATGRRNTVISGRTATTYRPPRSVSALYSTLPTGYDDDDASLSDGTYVRTHARSTRTMRRSRRVRSGATTTDASDFSDSSVASRNKGTRGY